MTIQRHIPVQRNADQFSIATLPSGEVVLFDSQLLQYHHLNAPAFALWNLCDGVRSMAQIAESLAQEGQPFSAEAVELAIADLTEAGLLETPQPAALQLSRRRVLRVAAATAIGVGAVPVVQSITAPASVSAQTYCTTVWESPGVCDPAGNVPGTEWNQTCTTLCAQAHFPSPGCGTDTLYCGRCVTWGTPLPPSGGCCQCSCNSACPFLP